MQESNVFGPVSFLYEWTRPQIDFNKVYNINTYL